jgi:hypothetical protein
VLLSTRPATLIRSQRLYSSLEISIGICSLKRVFKMISAWVVYHGSILEVYYQRVKTSVPYGRTVANDHPPTTFSHKTNLIFDRHLVDSSFFLD